MTVRLKCLRLVAVWRTHSGIETDNGVSLVTSSDGAVCTHWLLIVLAKVPQGLHGVGGTCPQGTQGLCNWNTDMFPH